MMKKLLTLFLLTIVTCAQAQNSTDELLDASKVRNYIHFTVIDNKLFYEIDKITNKRSHKTLPKDFCLTMEKRDNEVAIVFDYINPFKQKIILTETLEADGAYESLSKFYSAMKGLTGQLSKASASSAETSQSTGNPAGYKVAGESEASGIAKERVLLITAKSMTAWKYHFLNNSTDCINSADIFDVLAKADAAFYRKSDDPNIDKFYPTIVSSINLELLALDTVLSLKAYNGTLPQKIGELEKMNNEAATQLNKLKGWDYSTVFKTSTPICKSLKDYTKETIDNFIDDASTLLEKRKALVAVLKDINKSTFEFLKKCEDHDNTMIMARIPVSVEQVKIETIKLRDVSFKFDNYDLTLVEDEKKDIELGKLRIRNSHLLIPEFALGAFYTDLNYPSYSTTTNGSQTIVSGPTTQNYSLVAAASLNLVVNLHGLVNPMLQFGVGTAKELPSFLAGGGIRLSKPNHLSISFGGLWTWKKELDKLKPMDVIPNSEALESDLKYKFITKPSFYLGVNFGF